MPPHSYPYFTNHLHSTWSDGLGRWLRTLKVAAIAGTLGAAAGTIGAIAIVNPHREPTRPQIVADAGILTRPSATMGSGVQAAPLAPASPQAAPPHLPVKGASVASPPSPPGWPLLPGARPHGVEAAMPGADRLYDRAEPKDRIASKADGSETVAPSASERTDALAPGARGASPAKKPQIAAATEPATVLPVPRPPTVIVPPRVSARAAHRKRSPDSPGNWRDANGNDYGADDRDDWHDRDDRDADRGNWDGGFFGPFGGSDWRN